ncbi:uncharacterized protein LOC135208866 [Macrobrachium nipponense]|uniref:uncharacterized protein LOC135208866 n=1 Tax=Macrobrachium nipponense TaxID=159736 RepID=UPI0030C8C0AC
MFDELQKLLDVASIKREVVLFFLVVIPILLVYLGVSLYLLYAVCCNLQKKKKIKSKEVQTDDKITFVMNIDGKFLGQRETTAAETTENCTKLPTSPLTSTLRTPAQSALCEVIRRENLNALKSSLRKTQSDPISPLKDAGDKINGLQVELEEKVVVISSTKSSSDSDLFISGVHNSSMKEISTVVSSVKTATSSAAAEVSPVHSHSDLSKKKVGEVICSPSNVYQDLGDLARNESSPSSLPFVEIDLGNA